jgi:hypothetical protein
MIDSEMKKKSSQRMERLKIEHSEAFANIE